MEKIKHQHTGNGDVNNDDGLKLDFDTSWVHLRKSNTEPLIRIIAEAPSMDEAQRLAQKFKNKVFNSLV